MHDADEDRWYRQHVASLPPSRQLDLAEQERLARLVELGTVAREALEATSLPIGSDERTALRVQERAGAAAAAVLIQDHVGIVVEIARECAEGSGLPLPSLVLRGNGGLLEAVAASDRGGLDFPTHAALCIRRAITGQQEPVAG